MRKNTIFLTSVLIFMVACTPTIRNYEGYIYNFKKEPIEKLKITENDNLQSSTFTDSLGYFKTIENNQFGGDLIISLDNG
ncbi:hypothetical protein [Pedobacter sp. MW01-1-1]|uniref:hypothetical protein n=1 Tax=Pedobacter sp. MW01-1-1 TaxID=3383027 RepID=UPI003FEF624B